MAVKRVRAAVTGLQDERNRLGWRPVASALENWRWRLLDGPVRARSPRFGVNPETVQRISRSFDRVGIGVA